MECNETRRLLDFARPGVFELDGAELAALESHLADCPACNAAYRSERQRDERLAAAMQNVRIPADGRERTLARLTAARWAWWRNRALVASILAIGGLLGATVGFRYFGRPAFDPLTLAQAAYEQSGQGRLPDEARAIVEQWLRGIDRRLAAPAEWNYRLVAFLERTKFEGLSSVPTIVFTRGAATARIYVVRSAAFQNLDAMDQPVEEGGCTVAVRHYAELPGWAFIVVTSGGPIEFFLRPNISQSPA